MREEKASHQSACAYGHGQRENWVDLSLVDHRVVKFCLMGFTTPFARVFGDKLKIR